MVKNKPEQVDERAQQCLKLLIERFIAEGKPVASSKLAQDKSISLSSASVRNIMMELEAAGYIHAPHTSAGRVPTIQGYRYFVNSLLSVQPLEHFDFSLLEQGLDADKSVSALVQTTTELLSRFTKMAGVVTLPKRQNVLLKHIEFLPLSSSRVLCVLVFNDREVENRILHTKKAYSHDELQTAANFLNQHISGQSFTRDCREAVIAAMKQDQQDMETLLKTAIDAAEKTAKEKTEQDAYVMQGHQHLLELARNGNIDGLKTLFDAFSEKQSVLELLDGCFDADGLQIFIGEESGYDFLQGCSVVTSPYAADGQVLGALAVIGPTRMPYDRVIPIVDMTAKMLSAALKDSD